MLADSLKSGMQLHLLFGMAHPRVADGGDGLQMWRVAANILNKQSLTADQEWSSSLGGLAVGLTTPYHKKESLL
jgi:hypothetical protein